MLPACLVVDVSRSNGIPWDAIISCQMIGVYKPHPEAHHTAAEWLATLTNGDWLGRPIHGPIAHVPLCAMGSKTSQPLCWANESRPRGVILWGNEHHMLISSITKLASSETMHAPPRAAEVTPEPSRDGARQVIRNKFHLWRQYWLGAWQRVEIRLRGRPAL